MHVSLIITTYNWPAALDLSLASITLQTRVPEEVIVADDGSGPETAQVIEAWQRHLPCPVIHVWQEDLGFRVARSRNRAIARARGEYIVIIDGDMVMAPRFIEDHVACARADCFIQGARPQLSPAVTQRMLATRNPRATWLSPGLAHRSYALRSVLLSKFASRVKPSLAGIQGCNQSFWREHCLRVNGYDERFTGWGPEDREFAARLLHIGVQRNYVRHRAIAFHLYHKTRNPGANNPFDRLLTETLANRSVRAELGIEQPGAAPGAVPSHDSEARATLQPGP